MSPGAPITLHTLGGGRDVGRSCFLLTVGATRVLLDAGLHPARAGARERYPAFASIPSLPTVDVVLLSHAHVDHAGALPLLTEVAGHPGPVYASAATRDLLPPLYDELLGGGGGGGGPAPGERRPPPPPYTAAQAAAAVAKVVATPPPGTPWSPAPGVTVVAALAGHLLGALAFTITVAGRRVVYSGDLSVDEGPPSPLPAAALDRTAAAADLLLLEATAAGTWARPPRAVRLAGLLSALAAAVGGGGKALLAVPAVGRHAEVLLALDAAAAAGAFGGVPILGASPLGWRLNAVHRRHAGVYGSPYAASSSVPGAGAGAGAGAAAAAGGGGGGGGARRSPWAFAHITAYRRAEHWAPLIAAPGVPVVVVAAPGSLAGGVSRAVFAALAGDPRNVIVAPALAVATARAGLALEARAAGGAADVAAVPPAADGGGTPPPPLSAPAGALPRLPPLCATVLPLPLSAHADERGLVRAVRAVRPRAVALVHGEAARVDGFGRRLRARWPALTVLTPDNGSVLSVPTGEEAVARGG